MKSLRKVAQENKKTTTVTTIIMALLFVATFFVQEADTLGITTGIVRWVSFGVSAVTGLLTYVGVKQKQRSK